MADTIVERRQYRRKNIKLACQLQMNTGLILMGHTRNISYEGVFLETHGMLQYPRFQALKAGDSGVLTLQYKIGGSPESLKIRCRIAHIVANGIGVQMSTAMLSAKDQSTIERILQLETGNL